MTIGIKIDLKNLFRRVIWIHTHRYHVVLKMMIQIHIFEHGRYQSLSRVQLCVTPWTVARLLSL